MSSKRTPTELCRTASQLTFFGRGRRELRDLEGRAACRQAIVRRLRKLVGEQLSRLQVEEAALMAALLGR